MAVELSTEEAATVSSQSKSERELSEVVYFDANSRQERVISRDFESFLILQTTDQKQKALRWLKKVKEIQSRNKDRDELLAKALELDNVDSSARLSLYEDKLAEFDEFRVSFASQGPELAKFIGVAEVSALIRSMEKAMRELVPNRDRCYNNFVVTDILQTFHERNKTDEFQEKELASWQNPLSAYDGQQGESGAINESQVASSQKASRGVSA